MIKVKVGLTDGRSKILESDKRFDDITASEIMEKVDGCVIGWGLIESSNEIREAEDNIEADQ